MLFSAMRRSSDVTVWLIAEMASLVAYDNPTITIGGEGALVNPEVWEESRAALKRNQSELADGLLL